MKNTKQPLLGYIEALQAKGRYTFSRNEAVAAIEGSQDAFRF
jgi:hypothetical protein